MIADARKHRNRHTQLAIRRQVLLRGNRIFCFQIKAMQIRQHTNHRFTGFLLQPIEP
ncbi:Uncharacterised protein [Vibrio cholerae]|nr:Uncharacterised protein [Vibrio cholerae]